MGLSYRAKNEALTPALRAYNEYVCGEFAVVALNGQLAHEVVKAPNVGSRPGAPAWGPAFLFTRRTKL
jgi:hypothetical protein